MLPGAQVIAEVAVVAVLILAAIVFHEVAHGAVAYAFGDPTAARAGRLTLNPIPHIDPFGTVILPGLLLLLPRLLGTPGFVFGYARPVPVNFARLRRPQAQLRSRPAGPCPDGVPAPERPLAVARISVSGARPTGRQHLGTCPGALKNWRRRQGEHRCCFFVADWHALTTDWASPEALEENTVEMVLDWLAVGLDPARATLFQQSAVKEHAELYLLLGMLTPVPWLERNPTYKEQRAELQDRDLSTYGFLGYPVLQTADVLMYKACGVPVGIDQAPHIELTREIARRFNATYGDIFPEPRTLLTDTPRIAGTDGRKMSKSYGNAVFLTDTAKDVEQKLSRMITDPRRARRTDPGDPNDCPAFQSFPRQYCSPEALRHQEAGCRPAGIGCLECKQIMIKHVQAELEPIRARRARLEPADARAALEAGNATARAVAAETMAQVRKAVGL